MTDVLIRLEVLIRIYFSTRTCSKQLTQWVFFVVYRSTTKIKNRSLCRSQRVFEIETICVSYFSVTHCTQTHLCVRARVEPGQQSVTLRSQVGVGVKGGTNPTYLLLVKILWTVVVLVFYFVKSHFIIYIYHNASELILLFVQHPLMSKQRNSHSVVFHIIWCQSRVVAILLFFTSYDVRAG